MQVAWKREGENVCKNVIRTWSCAESRACDEESDSLSSAPKKSSLDSKVSPIAVIILRILIILNLSSSRINSKNDLIFFSLSDTAVSPESASGVDTDADADADARCGGGAGGGRAGIDAAGVAVVSKCQLYGMTCMACMMRMT